ncbi:MAG TPA: MFS transporter [Acidimicrobiia bacterium]|nr:MFS transporter [Acidimicrobiia bacterium]
MTLPRSILSRELLPASIAIFTAVSIVAFERLAVTAALPQVAAELGGVTLLPWVVTGFLLTSGVATAITGSFIDNRGTANVFRWATIVFALSSLAAGLASSMPMLVAARVVQGAAGGAIISVGVAAVTLVYPDHLTGRAFAANSNVWGILGFAGPAIAAAMLEIGSWRWIFLIMAPTCLAALVAGWRTLPEAVEPGATRVDWVSAGLLVTAVGAVLAAVSDPSLASIALVVLGAVAGALLWKRIGRPKSLFDRRFVASSPFWQFSAVAGLTVAAMTGIQSFLPVYVAGARGASASAAAWSVVWLTLGWTLAANVAGRVTDRVSEHSVLLAGAVLGPFALMLAWISVVNQAHLGFVFAAYFLMGVSVGTVTNALLQMLKLNVPRSSAGQATSVFSVARTIGLSVGAGLAGGIILAVVASRLGDVAEVRALLSGETANLGGGAAEALGSGFALAHLVALGLMLAAVAVVISLGRSVKQVGSNAV